MNICACVKSRTGPPVHTAPTTFFCRASCRTLAITYAITGCKPRIARCARTEGSKSVIELTWKFSVAPQLARTGEGGEQQDHTQKQCSEKCGGGHRSTQATYAPEARFFGPQTPETPAVSFSPCPLSCKGLGRF